MFHYTNKIISKNIDTYIYISCSDFEKNIKILQNKFNLKFPSRLNSYFKGEKNKLTKLLIKDKLFIIGKINEKSCAFKDVDNILKKICNMIQNDKKINNIQFFLIPIEEFIRPQVLRTVYYMYDFNKYKTEKNALKKTLHFCAIPKLKIPILNAMKEGFILNDMRDMVNEPGNTMTSTDFVHFAKKTCRSLKMELLKKGKLKKEQLNLILTVNKGSKNEPYLLILKWLPLKKQKPIVFVGKGVTFDTGGINLKPYDFYDMKTDMTGASVVLTLLRLCALNKTRKNVIGVIPLVENMIGSNAARPGDIITSHSKKTVEIMDTDAEGRLIMADALSYSSRFNPSTIIDVATLTGQAGRIFDNISIVIMGNDNKLLKSYEKLGKKTNERIWSLPLWEEYKNKIVSDIADVKNISNGAAGTIIGGVFLSEFIPKKTKWMHVDIAGISFNTNEKGATGISVMSLFELIKVLKN